MYSITNCLYGSKYFLVNGNIEVDIPVILVRIIHEEKAKNTLQDAELLNQFKEVEKLNQEDKHLVKTFIDAFLTKRHIQKLANT